MGAIIDRLHDEGLLLSDGAWGTMLIEQGLAPGECPELWNVTHPDAVRGVAARYVEAGAQLINTNSFGASRFKLDAYGLADRTAELNKAAARLSREAANGRALVVASIGPTGKFLITGEVTEEDLYEAFRVQAAALAAGGADGILVETMSDLDEAAAAIRAARDATALDVICTFTFDRTLTGEYRTMMGVAPEAMAEAVMAAGAHAIGANCSLGPDDMVPIVVALRAAAPACPILVQPNAGKPQITGDGRTVYPETAEHMAARVAALVEAGATMVGGCCGTTPAHIVAMGAALRACATRSA